MVHGACGCFDRVMTWYVTRSHTDFSTESHNTVFIHSACLVKRIQSQAYEARTYKARASEFSSSIAYSIVKDLIRCKKIDLESPRLGAGVEQVWKIIRERIP